MIGFDRPLRPHWIYETLLLAEPGQKTSELNEPFRSIAKELTGNEGKRKVRTVLFRCFLKDSNSTQKVKENLILKSLSEKYGLDFMKPIYLFYLISKTEILIEISKYIFRLYDYGEQINPSFLSQKIKNRFGDRDVVRRSARAFLATLELFDILEKQDNSFLLKSPMSISDEQLKIILYLHATDILNSPQISIRHLPDYIFSYFDYPDINEIARKYNGIDWQYEQRTKESFLIVHEGYQLQ